MRYVEMKIQIVKEDVKSLNVDLLKYLALDTNSWLEAGESKHKLYSYLSTLISNSVIVDIGTDVGGSAVALAHNPTNKVITYDLVYKCADRIGQPNVIWKIENFVEDTSLDFDSIKIIAIDVDHEDELELQIINYIRSKNWKGILLLNDINHPEIQKIWNDIPDQKFDLTDIGDKTGTGVVNFGNKYEIAVVN
jgi:hypothetical protein